MTFREDLFAGKVALVVGGTGGIGAAIADSFATLGAVVTITGATLDDVTTVRNDANFAAVTPWPSTCATNIRSRR